MRDTVVSHLGESFVAYRDLARSLPAGALDRKVSIPSNTIGAQFWCVLGARESYTRAIETGKWAGFSCSLSGEDVVVQDKVITAFQGSESEFDRVVSQSDWTSARDDLLLGLLEHEIQHQGQLIRYVYGLGYEFPETWVKRWQL
jgi:hypothetical protein